VRQLVCFSLTREQRELLEKFADSSGEDVHPQSKNFFEKVRELFGQAPSHAGSPRASFHTRSGALRV